MKQLLEALTEEMGKAFAAAGYDAAMGKVGVSARPDLAEYQCNGAMAGAKQYHKAPFMIAEDVAAKLQDSAIFEDVAVVKPGFINLNVKESYLQAYLQEMTESVKFGMPLPEQPKTVVLDYGGPNVAKPLHVGHLRSAVIGEAIKRMVRYHGDTAIGDIHLGDWGLQMGLVITELRHRQPELVYFDESYEGDYPEEAPFTVGDLEEIYPFASGKSKEDESYHAEALENTHKLQEGNRGYRALWKHIMSVSVADMKRNYANLNVTFDLWNGESTVNDLIAPMVAKMKEDGKAYESEGALVVDVAEETDAKEVPPCMILKSDGAALYTVNGKDGKPFKTRDGGVMRLETLISDINEEMQKKIESNPEITGEEAKDTAQKVALAAIKYGDLSNQASKDYIFDTEKFTSFEGDTGPYILYTIVRIKSILAKYQAAGGRDLAGLAIAKPQSKAEKSLMQDIAGFGAMMEGAYEDCAPHRICAYIYQLSNDFNSFYHGTRILAEEDAAKKEGWIALLKLTRDILETCIDVLGFSAPERM